jgi:hypothetical protein
MRTIGLGLALAASAQLTLLSSPAMADDQKQTTRSEASPPAPDTKPTTGSEASPAPDTKPTTGTQASPPAPDTKSTTGYEASAPPRRDSSKATTGWILLGGGGALALAGIVVDAVGAGQNQVSGQGGAGDTSVTQHQKFDLLFAGTTMIIAGVAAGIYGGSFVLQSKRDNQDASSAPPPPAQGSTDPVTKAAQASLASAPTVVVPVLGARF